MPAPGWKSLTINDVLYERLKKRWEEEDKPLIPFTPWVAQYILENLEEDELLRRYSPGLQFIGAEGDIIDIADHFIDRIVEVQVVPEGRFLYCRHCDSDSCLHVGFAFAIREVNKILVERGFKKPRVKEIVRKGKEVKKK